MLLQLLYPNFSLCANDGVSFCVKVSSRACYWLRIVENLLVSVSSESKWCAG